MTAGRDDLAREALNRRAAANTQLADLQTQHADLQAQEEKLTQASQQLQAKVDAFRTRKETIKATYTAAEAQTKIGEAVSGHLRGDGRRRPRDAAGRGQDAADAGPSRRRRRADRLRRTRRRHRRRQGRHPGASSTDVAPAATSSSSSPSSRARCRPGRRPSAIAADDPGRDAGRGRARRAGGPRSGASRDRPHPRRGSARRPGRQRSDELNALDTTLAAGLRGRRATRRSAPRLPRCSTGSASSAAVVPDDHLGPSELVFPSADASLAEVSRAARRGGTDPRMST